MARVYHHNAAAGRNTTTSTTPQDQVSLTFTPNASKVYLLLWGCLLDNDSTSADSFCRLYNSTDAAALQTFNIEAEASVNKFQLTGAAIYTAPGSPGSMSFKVQYYSESTNTTGCQDAWLIALELDADDFQSVTTAEQGTASDTYVDIGPSVTLPAGDYLLLISAEAKTHLYGAGGGTAGHNFRLYDGTGDVIVTGPPFSQELANYNPWWGIVRVTPGSSTTYKAQFKGASTSATVYVRNTTLVALDLAQFADVIYGDSLGESSTTSSSAQTKLSVTDTPLAMDYLQLFACSRKHNSTSTSGYTDYTRGGSPISVEAEYEADDTDDYVDHGYGVISELTASSTTWTTRYRNEDNSATTYIKNAAFVALGLEDGVTHYSIAAAQAGLDLAGPAAGVAAQRRLAAAQAALDLAGPAAALVYDSADPVLSAAGAALDLSGPATGLAVDRRLAAPPAALEIAGPAASPVRGRILAATSAALDLAGPAAALAAQRRLAAAFAGIDLSGLSASLSRSYGLAAVFGGLDIIGPAVALLAIEPIILLPVLKSCWSPENLLRRATVSASSEAAGLPLSNAISDPHGGTVWRALAASATISAAWATARSLRAFALAHTSLSSSARLRLRLSNVEAGGIDAWDSDWLAGDIEPGFGQWVLVLEQAVSARFLEIEIVDPGNSSGFFDVGIVWAGDAIETAFNPVWGMAVGHDDTSQGRASLGGQTYSLVRPKVRVARGSYDLLPESQALGALLDLARRGTGDNVLFVPEPGIRARNREAVIGLLQKSHRLPVTAFGRAAWDFEVRERL
ncbi:MAG: hypothetical protein AB7R90_19515 [Reyranellaceae bacterium]